MKVDLLRLIEDSLVGGRNGEMAYIENNPFIAQIFREYLNNNGGNFKSFLEECINDDKPEKENNISPTSKVVKKRIQINTNSEEYRSFSKANNEVSQAIRERDLALKLLAEKTDEVLAKVGNYEIHYGEYSTNIEFSIVCKDIIN